MEHLLVHLVYKAIVCGPTQNTWIYPIERYNTLIYSLVDKLYCLRVFLTYVFFLQRDLYDLKNMVKNKARVEGSIAEAYLTHKLTTFCSLYFGSDVLTKLNKPDQNCNGMQLSDGRLSIICHTGKPKGREDKRNLTNREYQTFLYVLLNYEEVNLLVE
ncbi:DUF4218 domain-containing protein [Cephalotus follicularis]|uniref:DUF4218 domain-containing protein n=1 Tax=Cephalotus follicularis TaxID=3775 RepID=A0A1Q3C9G4_CEPFO|nr:DUF4218 domain-containing protein [Cephalotus follicularis]